ncbi:hypothetical protein TWF730_006714 [Orbilia blumenaviensis]|uniref:F-box domain-containing protein n=1 Tax=Orbilia blumenaviensis TaxID=1796055 RepID=A0AAV9VF39_9PEZI
MQRQSSTGHASQPPMKPKNTRELIELPRELIDEITMYLSMDDIIALRCSCKRLDFLAKKGFYDNVFTLRRYYWTSTDLQALVKLARKTSNLEEHLRPTLKHLIIEADSPYVYLHPDRNPPEGQFSNLSEFRSIIEKGFNYYSRELRVLRLCPILFSYAVLNLKNIAHIEIHDPNYSKGSRVPDDVILSHYRKFFPLEFKYPALEPNKKPNAITRQFFDFYRWASVQMGGTVGVLAPGIIWEYFPSVIPLEAINNVLCALRVQKREIRIFGVPRPPSGPAMGAISYGWFHKNCCSKIDNCRPVMEHLNGLTLDIERPLDPDIRLINKHRLGLCVFLRYPVRLKWLNLSFSSIDWAVIWKTEKGEYRPYVPLLLPELLDASSNALSFLSQLRFDMLAFSEKDILKFLTDRKDTLRRVKFVNCRLQARWQVWWEIFAALELLSLDFFEYECTNTIVTVGRWRVQSGEAYSSDAISWFRLYGNISTMAHHCELVPESHKGNPIEEPLDKRWKVSYKKAITAVKAMERVLLHGIPAETIFEAYVEDFSTHPGQGRQNLILCDDWKRGPKTYRFAVPIPPTKVEETLVCMEIIEKKGWEYDDPAEEPLAKESFDG